MNIHGPQRMELSCYCDTTICEIQLKACHDVHVPVKIHFYSLPAPLLVALSSNQTFNLSCTFYL